MATPSASKDEETEYLLPTDENSYEINSNVEVNIALVGQTESGKSSFINALMGLDEDDKYAAKTGDGNTTADPKDYYYPKAKYIKLWDLPGHSTPSYPNIRSYSKYINLNYYDAFLLFTKGCLTNNDIILAKEIESKNKPLFLVRPNIDYDVYNKSRKQNFDEEVMLKKIRTGILKNADDLLCSQQDIFLISNIQPEQWDFFLLSTKIEEFGSDLYKERLQKMKAKKDYIMKKECQHALDTIMEKGMRVAQLLMEQRLERWTTIEIKVAVIGHSGVGKSSFINAIRNVGPNDDLAAKVGVIETTTREDTYAYPSNSNIVLCDLPGVGTSTIPDIKTYSKKFKIFQYDMFIIMMATRLTDYDVRLAKTLESMYKPLFFVRATIDQDVENEKAKEELEFDETKLKRIIIDECSDKLKDFTSHQENIYLISNKYPKRWDFPRLVTDILKQLSHHEKECFSLTQPVISKSDMKRKVQDLQGRTWMVALWSTTVSTPTSSNYSTRINGERIVNKVKFYREQLQFPNDPPPKHAEVTRFYLTNDKDVMSWLQQFDNVADYDRDDITWEQAFPVQTFKFLNRSLKGLLKEMGIAALTYFME